MKTPLYPPASAYEPPAVSPYRLSLGGASIAELLADAQAWAIVLRHMPMLEYLVASPMAQSQLPNMTVIDFGTFGTAPDPALVATVDAELALLPLRGEPR
jgi:hypothetical protein